MNFPSFETWQHENLVKFSIDAYAKLREQDETIQELQRDLKTAIEAYRGLLRKVEDDWR
jgi:hypothetical protein